MRKPTSPDFLQNCIEPPFGMRETQEAKKLSALQLLQIVIFDPLAKR
jgi:hypothetical protein